VASHILDFNYIWDHDPNWPILANIFSG